MSEQLPGPGQPGQRGCYRDNEGPPRGSGLALIQLVFFQIREAKFKPLPLYLQL